MRRLQSAGLLASKVLEMLLAIQYILDHVRLIAHTKSKFSRDWSS